MKVRGALYIPTYEYNYKVITGCDTILKEYYITDTRKCKNTKRYNYEHYKKCSRDIIGKLECSVGGLEGKDSGRSGDDPCFHCTSLISNRVNSQGRSSRIWIYRFMGARNSPTSGVMNAKWRAGISTSVSPNLNQNMR